MKITPLIVGSGRSAQVTAKSLAMLSTMSKDLEINAPQWIKRGTAFAELKGKFENPAVFITNPHGVHTKLILEAEASGFTTIACEKPVCVNLEELALLKKVKANVAILHVYRQMWGSQTLKEMLLKNEFGEIVSIEGRYWQASSAEQALLKLAGDKEAMDKAAKSWKNDTALSGKFDAFIDIAVHWVDLVCYLKGEKLKHVNGFRSYVNAENPHRDTHVHLDLNFMSGGRAFGSISKTMHGTNNHFEVNIIGAKQSATWCFQNPDEIIIGQGRDRKVITRKTNIYGSGQPAFHGMGWMEGYLEIFKQLLRESFLKEKGNFPRLPENLEMMQTLFQTNWT